MPYLGNVPSSFNVGTDNINNDAITTAKIADGAILNADVNAAAAIAGTKISPDFGSQNILTTGTATAASLIPTSSTVPTNGLYLPAANSVAISTNGTGRLFVDASGRVGVGDSSPSARLVCNGSIQVTSSTNPTTGAGLEIGYGTVNASRTALQSYNRTGSTWLGADYNALDHRFYISGGGSPQMTLTSTGLGIGTTNPATPLHVNSGAISTGARLESSSAGAYLNFANSSGNGVYIGANTSAFYVETNGSERARIDSSGRLLVGTSSARSFLGITNQIQIEGAGDNGSLSLTTNRNDSFGSFFSLVRSRGTTAGSTTVVQNGDQLGGILFAGTDGSAVQQGASIYAFVDGTPGANDMPGRLVFSVTRDGQASPTEALRINNAGYLKASYNGSYVNSAGAWHEMTAAENGSDLLYLRHAGTTNPFGVEIQFSGAAPNNISNWFLYCYDTGTNRAVIRANGGLANYQANNVNLSDINTKKDISPAAGTWDCIKEWEIVNYRYKDQPDDADLNLGVIAQQVAESCPEVITVYQEAKEATEDKPAQEERLGIKEQQMYWMAIKALQEAQVRIEALEAEMVAVKAQLS